MAFNLAESIRHLREIAGEHHEVIVDASIGSPQDPPLPKLRGDLAGQLRHDEINLKGYPATIGKPDLRASIMQRVEAEFGSDALGWIDLSNVAFANGLKGVIGTLAPSLYEFHGSESDRNTLIIPNFGYPTNKEGAIRNRAEFYEYEMTEDGSIDLEAIPEETLKNALGMIVNSPHNPTGTTMSREQYRRLAEFANEHGIPVISDETYHDVVWIPNQDKTKATIAEFAENSPVVALFSTPKIYRSAGIRGAYLAGNQAVVESMTEYHKMCGVIGNNLGQAATKLLLDNHEFYATEARERYKDVLTGTIAALGSFAERESVDLGDLTMPDGGIYAWIKAPGDMSGLVVAELLAEDIGLVTSPGLGYGEPGRNHLRVAATYPRSQISVLQERAV